MNQTVPCPSCHEPASFSKKRNQYFCAECELGFEGDAAISSSAPSPTAVKQLKLFLSYGRDEYASEALALKEALEARGHEVWFDQDQLRKGDWEKRIEDGLNWCDRVVLTMTPHSVRRPEGYCLNEIAKALEFNKLIIPLLLVEVPQGAPTSICRIQYLDWRDAVPAAEKSERFAARLSRLCEAIEDDLIDFEGGQQRLIRALQPLDYAGDVKPHVARFYGRAGLFHRLREWADDPEGQQVLWLCGGPGLGKSAIAAQLAHSWGELGAVHFCSTHNRDKADPARAVLSIAYQLSMRFDTYRGRLMRLDLEREAEKDASTLFDQLLVGPLSNKFPTPPGVCMVVIDALDEATQADGSNALAELIASQWSRLPRWLRLVVSSRPDPEVRRWMGGIDPVMINGADEEQQTDLSAYVKARLEVLGRSVNAEVTDRILEHSEGSFQYVISLLEDIRQGRCNPENPVDLPRGMNNFYMQSFTRRFKDPAVYRSLCRPLLELILAAPEPVPLAVLASALNTDVMEVRHQLDMLGSMLNLQPAELGWDPKWDTVRLAHASLRTWLTGLTPKRQPTAGQFAIEDGAGTKKLADEVLKLWRQGDGQENQKSPGRHAFVCRTVFDLLQSAGDSAALDEIALDVSSYWGTRSLRLAIEPMLYAVRWAEFVVSDTDSSGFDRQKAANSFSHMGDLCKSLGFSSKAFEPYQKSSFELERLAAQHPENAGWQRELVVSIHRIGGILESQGDLAGAIVEFRKAQAVSERLAVQDPDNASWQREIALSINGIGSILNSQGDFAGALVEFRKALAISERLAAQDPDNAGRQRDLGWNFDPIGGILASRGDLAGALVQFRKALAISERLATQDPDSAGWQHDLGVRYDRIGGILESQGDLAGALVEFRKALAISERLAAQDPDNADRQRDLGRFFDRIGGILASRGDLAGALVEFRKNLVICEWHATQDFDNPDLQHALSMSFARIGDILSLVQ